MGKHKHNTDVEHHDPDKRLGAVSAKTGVKTLRVFDFDDTLVQTNSKVGVTEHSKLNGEQLREKYWLSAAEYAVFQKTKAANPGVEYRFDYTQFIDVVEPKLVEGTFKILQRVIKKMRSCGGIPAIILTARGHHARDNIKEFLLDLDIDLPVVTLDNSNPTAKAAWLKQAMLARNIPHVEFFDDSPLNVKAVEELMHDPVLLDTFGSNLSIKSRLISVNVLASSSCPSSSGC